MDMNRLIAERLVHQRMKNRLRESNVLSISLNPKKVERAMKASGYQDDEVLEFLYDKYGLEDGEDYQLGNGDLDFLFYKSTKADKCISELGTGMRESTEPAPRSYYKKVEDILNHQLGSYETGVDVENIEIISETPGTITLKVEYEVRVQIPMVDPEDGRTYYEQEVEYRTRTMTFDFDELDESVDSKQFKVGDEVSYSMLYGGSVDAEVVKVTSRSITLREKWTAEDTGDEVSAGTEYELHKDEEGREYIVVWKYRGEEGRVYPPDTLDESVDNNSMECVIPVCFGYEVWQQGDKYFVLNGEGDTVYTTNSTFNAKKWCKEHKTSNKWRADSKWDWSRSDESKSSARLGDEVTWRGNKYIIISDEDDELQLRPSDMVDDDSFDGYGDSSEDVFLGRWQLKEDLSIDDDPEETDQQYSSAATSINSSKLPALFKMVDFEEGSINLDYGGGKFDNVAEYLEDTYGATNLVYDKYNRSAEHNKEVLNQVRKNGGADTVTCSNVLNVIAEESERLAVLRNCKRYLKSGGTCYITVYEGSGSGEGSPTKAGYQLNRKTKDYEDEIRKVFSNVTRKGKLFICR